MGRLIAGGSRPSDLAGLAELQSWPDQRGETGNWTATESISTSLSFIFSLHVHSAQMTAIMFRRRSLVPRLGLEAQRASSVRKPQGVSRQSWQRFGLFDRARVAGQQRGQQRSARDAG